MAYRHPSPCQGNTKGTTVRIKRIDDQNIGYEHNELAAVGRRLRADGEDALAVRYFERAQEAQEIYSHLAGIGDAALAQRESKTSPLESGIDLANWLMKEGWTPPPLLPILDEPHPATLDDDNNFYF